MHYFLFASRKRRNRCLTEVQHTTTHGHSRNTTTKQQNVECMESSAANKQGMKEKHLQDSGGGNAPSDNTLGQRAPSTWLDAGRTMNENQKPHQRSLHVQPSHIAPIKLPCGTIHKYTIGQPEPRVRDTTQTRKENNTMTQHEPLQRRCFPLRTHASHELAC